MIDVFRVFGENFIKPGNSTKKADFEVGYLMRLTEYLLTGFEFPSR